MDRGLSSAFVRAAQAARSSRAAELEDRQLLSHARRARQGAPRADTMSERKHSSLRCASHLGLLGSSGSISKGCLKPVLLLCVNCKGQSESGAPELPPSGGAADEASDTDGDTDSGGDLCPNVPQNCPEECFALEGGQVLGDCYGGYAGILGCTTIPEDGLVRAGLIGRVKRISYAALFSCGDQSFFGR